MPFDPRSPRVALAAHAFLAASMAGWRAVAAGSERARSLLESHAGELLLALWVPAGVAALALAALGTLRARGDVLLRALALLLALSLARRQPFDVFDLAYLLAVPWACVLRAAWPGAAASRASA